MAMSTWGEDFSEAMESFGLHVPGTLKASEVAGFIVSVRKYVEDAQKVMPAAAALAAMYGTAGTVAATAAATALVEAAAFVTAMSIATYLGAIIVSAAYATAHQGWEALTDEISLATLNFWAEEVEAPKLNLPVTEEVTPYPTTAVTHDDWPPYPGYVLLQGTSDAASTRLIQKRLQALGYAFVEIDGIYGTDTAKGVRQFQQKNNLYVDGKVGEDTWPALFPN